jgi:hypothetical protein
LKNDGRAAGALKQQALAVQILKAQFSKVIDEEGEDFVEALVEGQTDFVEVVSGVAAHILFLEAQADGVKNLADKYAASAARRKATAKALRALLAVTLETAGEKKAGPVSLSAIKPKAVVTNESLLPDEYWKAQDPKIDQAKLNKDINEPGRVIPGVSKGNGSNTIRITT